MSNYYTPRRAGQRWREAAPDYILDCFDNRGETADRYTVLFVPWDKRKAYKDTFIPYLGASADPSSAQGIGITDELEAYKAAQYRYRVKHRRVRWLDLPEAVRNAARAFYEDDA